MSRLIGENLKESYFFFFSNYLPLQIWTLKICNRDILKTIYRGYSIFLLNMAFISPSEVENIYIS